MKSRMFLSLAMATMSLIFAAGCSQTGAKKKQAEAKEANNESAAVTAPRYATLIFDQGKSSLTDVSKEHLKELTMKARESQKTIEEIRILSWADKEYPEKNQPQGSTGEIILASERSRNIREFLEEELDRMENIDSFNMARRPSLVSKVFKNDEFIIKEAIEKSGPTAAKLPDGSLSYTKASKAVVIIDYEDEKDKQKNQE